MRSEQVFRANEQIVNRYALCRLTARTTRCLHFASSSTQDAIQDAFVRMSSAGFFRVPSTEDAAESRTWPAEQRDAAQ